MKRRDFLLNLSRMSGGLFLARTLPLGLLGSSTAFAITDAISDPEVLVFVFARGAMDGLSYLIPHSDPFYQSVRPHIGLKVTGDRPALQIDSQFALHPALSSLIPLWKQQQIAFIPQSGSPDPTRSHFDAQDFMENGAPGVKNVNDGFLNRALQATISKGGHADPKKVMALALQPSLPRSLAGSFPAISMNSIRDFNIKPGGPEIHASASAEGFEKMYSEAADQVFHGLGQEVSDAIASVQKAQPIAKAARESGIYPKGEFSDRMREIASLVKAQIGVQIAVTEHGGFDTHVRQGAAEGQLADRFKDFAETVEAFRKDLGDHFGKVTVVLMTEFGRTVRENGTGGTDHGHGSVMTVLGGQVRGGIHGQWKDLKPENLYENRDAPVNTDFRMVMSEILARTLRLDSQAQIFPKYAVSASAKLNLFRS